MPVEDTPPPPHTPHQLWLLLEEGRTRSQPGGPGRSSEHHQSGVVVHKVVLVLVLLVLVLLVLVLQVLLVHHYRKVRPAWATFPRPNHMGSSISLAAAAYTTDIPLSPELLCGVAPHPLQGSPRCCSPGSCS